MGHCLDGFGAGFRPGDVVRTAPGPRRLGLVRRFVAYYGALLLFGIVSASWSLVAYPLRLVLPRRIAARLGRHVISRGFAVFVALLDKLGIAHCDLRELDGLRGEGRLVIVANHPSIIDAVLLISRLPRASCIMKGTLAKSRFLGAGARLAGYIRNDRPITLMRGAIDCLKGGGQLVIFPEGTRTGVRPIDPFTGGFAAMARGADAPIQTVIIETTNVASKFHWSLLRKPQLPLVYRVRLGRRFDPDPDVRRVTAEVERHVRAELSAKRRDIQRRTRRTR